MSQSSASKSSAWGCHPRQGFLLNLVKIIHVSGVLVGRIFTPSSSYRWYSSFQVLRTIYGLSTVLALIASWIYILSPPPVCSSVAAQPALSRAVQPVPAKQFVNGAMEQIRKFGKHLASGVSVPGFPFRNHRLSYPNSLGEFSLSYCPV